MTFYFKNSKNEFIPVEPKEIVLNNWKNKLVVLKVGTELNNISSSDLDVLFDSIENSRVLRDMDTSVLITPYNIEINIVDDLEDIGEKMLFISVRDCDNVSELGELQRTIKDKFKDKFRKIVIAPSPLTIKEYLEIMEVKKRCDRRRSRNNI